MTKPFPNYSPFGSIMPTRVWSDASREYRYSFNGKEKDFETASDNFDFGARIYDGRLGRWLSVDPLMAKYPYVSPFAFCANNPIIYQDKDGRDFIITIDAKTHTITISAIYYCNDKETYLAALSAAIDIMAGNGKIKVRLKGELKKYKVNFNLKVILVSLPESTDNSNLDQIADPVHEAAGVENGNSIESENFIDFDNRARTQGFTDEEIHGFTIRGFRIIVRKPPLDPNWKFLYPTLKENIKKQMLSTLGLKQKFTEITKKSILTILNYANNTNKMVGEKINFYGSSFDESSLTDDLKHQPNVKIIHKARKEIALKNQKVTAKDLEKINLKNK